MPPKKRNRPKVTPGQVRGIVREMNQPPHGARKRPRVSQPKLVARTKFQEAPKAFGKVQVKRNPRGGVGRKGFVPVETKINFFRERMSPKPRKKVASIARPPVQKPLRKANVVTRATGKPRLKANTSTRRRISSIDIRTLPDLIRRGVISRKEANDILAGIERRTKRLPVETERVQRGSEILRRELNLTETARARLDAEEARLAEEARRTAIKQEEESKRNPRVQNPRTGPRVIPGGRGRETTIIDPDVDDVVKAILKNKKARQAVTAEIDKEEEAEKQRRPKKPLRPRGGVGIAPIMPGAGGGLIPRIK